MTRAPTRRQALTWIAAVPALGTALARAEAPPGTVVLSITGRIERPNAGERHDFDMAALAALPQREVTVKMPWYRTKHTFSGPLLRDVLAAAGASGTRLTAVALNDYRVDLPVADAHRWPVLVATQRDGQPMAVRDKGPLFIVYPYDDSAELRSAQYFARSAWQLRRIEVQ